MVFGRSRGIFNIFVFFNLKRFFQTVFAIVIVGSSSVHYGTKKVADAPVSGLVLGPKCASRAIFENSRYFFLFEPQTPSKRRAQLDIFLVSARRIPHVSVLKGILCGSCC